MYVKCLKPKYKNIKTRNELPPCTEKNPASLTCQKSRNRLVENLVLSCVENKRRWNFFVAVAEGFTKDYNYL